MVAAASRVFRLCHYLGGREPKANSDPVPATSHNESPGFQLSACCFWGSACLFLEKKQPLKLGQCLLRVLWSMEEAKG